MQDHFSGRPALTWLFLYRLILLALLVLMVSLQVTAPWFSGGAQPLAVRITLGIQGGLILLGGLAILLDWPGRQQQVQIAVFLDILVYTVLMHLSGGVSSGLGVLPAIAVVAGAILMEGRLSLLFASLATLGIMAQQIYAHRTGAADIGGYTQAGLLGLTYFAVALLAHVLTKRLRESERLAARRKVDLADLSKLNEYIIQRMSVGVLVIDGERRRRLANSAARELLQVPHARAGDALFELVPALQDWFERALAEASACPEALHQQTPIQQAPNRQASDRQASEQQVPIPPEPTAKEPVVTVGDAVIRPTLHLISERRRDGALITLRDNRELLRQARDMKLAALGHLTASIAHNIRNPLSSVAHAGQLLGEAATLNDEDRHLLDILQRNTRRIDDIVSSVLQLSRRREPDMQTLDLEPWLAELRDEYSETNQAAGERLRVEIDGGPHRVRADPHHLSQILRNLCDNAFKHGARDGQLPRVVLHVARDPRSDRVVLSVTDSGPGIAQAHLEHLFEPFFTTSGSGTGLGLYTARELAESNGLQLEYTEQAGPGGCFRLTFGPQSTVMGGETTA
ncbi:PAS domain-containing protein [Thiohalocapsa marina]|uniref:histidine kinase n=1 Tax=Thiohalocapsa marina TaxID=424902 RepID=A0A5M8FVE3_9GAMM|nr:ATP-binding protein [Thiohalocapsa marina]KAA6187733.1 PAS domain-containing protein [Thiohalocapsa marina]